MNPLSDAEKVDIRRLCGYPAYGAAPTGMQSWRYFQVYGLLEFRLNNLGDAELVIARRYIGTLNALEVAIPATSDGLDTDQASVWTRNKDELADRIKLFDEWRRRLCGFLGVAAGPGLSSGSATLIV
ncbi:MAG TPA: hypothetical protein DDZ81_07860 [Acetobacteraceae bacterium]|nr:hypothetical protein [Acetobacteraceae bacterium]